MEASAALGCRAMEASAAVCDRNTSGDRQSRLTSSSFPRRSVASAQQSWHVKDGGGEWIGVRGVGVGVLGGLVNYTLSCRDPPRNRSI